MFQALQCKSGITVSEHELNRAIDVSIGLKHRLEEEARQVDREVFGTIISHDEQWECNMRPRVSTTTITVSTTTEVTILPEVDVVAAFLVA